MFGTINSFWVKQPLFFFPSFEREVKDSIKSHLRRGRDGYQAGIEGKTLIFITLNSVSSHTYLKFFSSSYFLISAFSFIIYALWSVDHFPSSTPPP